MKAKRLRSMRLCLILIVTMALIVVPVRADDPGLRSSSDITGPVGAIDSSGSIAINGRLFQGEQAVWKGDLLQTSESSAQLMLHQIGEVRLESKTGVRISTTLADADSRRALIASVISGTMMVKLDSEAAAHIEAGEMIYKASPGSSFRVRMNEGRAFIDSVNGSVTVDSEVKPRVITTVKTTRPKTTRTASTSPTPIPVGQPVSVKQGSKTVVGGGVVKRRLRSEQGLVYVSATKPLSDPVGVVQEPDEIEEPAPNRNVRFSIAPPIGVFDPPVKTTDKNGMFEVEFRSLKVGRATITAVVIDIDPTEEAVPWIGEIEVLPAGIPMWKKLVVFGSIGAGVIIWRSLDDGRGPLHKEGPPVVFPLK